MKMIKKNAIYVEKKDVDFINCLPSVVHYEKDKSNYYNDNFYKFVTYRAIEFFKDNDVILDYDYLNALDNDKLQEEIIKINNYLSKWTTALYNNFHNQSIIDNDKDFIRKKQCANYMINTIEDYIKNKDQYDEMFSNVEEKGKIKELKM